MRAYRMHEVDGLPLFASGRLRPLVDRVFAFEQLAQAKAGMERNEHLGKIVLAASGLTVDF